VATIYLTLASRITSSRLEFADGQLVTSAGLEPGVLNPYTVQVFEERGIATNDLYAKGVIPMLGKRTFHYLITVCARAEQNCPVFPGVSYRLA